MAAAATAYQYTLTGFGEFLEWRTVRFVEPMPRIRVCRLCGVVSSVARLLPCTHVLCDSCERQAADRGRQCPIDGAAFEREEVQTMPFARQDLAERQVRCINDEAGGDRALGCIFTGKLAALEEHFLAHCMHGLVRCSKCGRRVVRKDAVEHYVGCEGGDSASPGEPDSEGKVTLDAAEAGRLAETIKEIQQELKNSDLGTPKTHANIVSLKRKAVSLGNFLRVLDPHASQGDASRRSSCYDSELDSWTICKFEGIEAMRKSNEQTLSLKEPCKLAGYTFTLACKFEKSRGKLSSVSFLFCLCPGDRDDFLEWPFAKKVKLSINHTTMEGRDIPVTLKICQEKNAESLKRPQPDVPPKGILSEKITWKYIEKKDLVRDDCLFVAVEFE
ncbi:uncharacterized protein [Dermacentor andersoni]|uniref:uncharacterized protein n=1 Tax=Dermacentor andersoni TaxID=34620 RepID=UPI00215514C7|nr:uncharacterized protein LOC126528009 [Dermacentor andersoni]